MPASTSPSLTPEIQEAPTQRPLREIPKHIDDQIQRLKYLLEYANVMRAHLGGGNNIHIDGHSRLD